MVRGKLTHFFAVVLLLCVGVISAGWSEPVFLPELNDYVNGWAATTPRLTADQSVILFRRQALGISEYTLFEAHRNPSTNIFENVRIVSELGSNGGAITWHWLSLDGLRLYYAEVVDINKIPQRVIRMAARNNVNEQWRFVRTLMELHLNTVDTFPNLTGDERTIFWHSAPVGQPGSYYTNTRLTIWHPFGNIKPVNELNAIGAGDPFLCSDGLTVYFNLLNGQGLSELWTGRRASLGEPFADFEPVDEINQWGVATNRACLSPDGKTLYFFQRWGAQRDVTTMGICVSHWQDEPYVAAVKNLQQAVEQKERAGELISEAIEKELRAIRALCSLSIEQLPEGLQRKDVFRARISILQAMQRQVIARMNLRQSLEDLARALGLLAPQGPQPAAESAGADVLKKKN